MGRKGDQKKIHLQGVSSGVDEAEALIRDLKDKEAQNTQLEEKKMNQKNWGYLRASGTNSSIQTFALRGYNKQRRDSKELKTYLKK